MRRSIGLLPLLLLALWATVPPAGACACGVALEAEVTRERALVIERPGSEEIVASFDLVRDGRQPAVVLPVPGDPEVEAIEQGDPLAYLDQVTASRAPAVGARGGDEGAGAPVDVIGREEVGGYDVTRLRADDPEALAEWLDRNGYTLPAGAEPILDDYVEEGWRFVAIRLAPGTEGRLKPLSVSFPTDSPVYPMRLASLGTAPVNLTLYVLAGEERAANNLEQTFSEPVDELEPPPPPELRELFEAAPHVTRLEARGATPATFTSDIELESGAAGGGGGDDGGPRLSLIAAGIAAVLGAIGLLLALRRERPGGL